MYSVKIDGFQTEKAAIEYLNWLASGFADKSVIDWWDKLYNAGAAPMVTKVSSKTMSATVDNGPPTIPLADDSDKHFWRFQDQIIYELVPIVPSSDRTHYVVKEGYKSNFAGKIDGMRREQVVDEYKYSTNYVNTGDPAFIWRFAGETVGTDQYGVFETLFDKRMKEYQKGNIDKKMKEEENVEC